MWKDYAAPGGTFRENLRREPGKPRAPATHPSAAFRYNALKEQGLTDEKGDVYISRKPAAPVEVPTAEVEGLSISENKTQPQSVAATA